MAHITSSEFSFLRAFSEWTWCKGLKCSDGGRFFQIFFWRMPILLPCTGGKAMRSPEGRVGLALLIQFVGTCGEGGSCKLATSLFQLLAAARVLMATSIMWVCSFSNSIGFSSLWKQNSCLYFFFRRQWILDLPRFSVLLWSIFVYVSNSKIWKKGKLVSTSQYLRA